MKKVVYKYEIPPADPVTLDLPVGAVPLHFAAQNNRMMLWALVNPKRAETKKRYFRLAGTGHPITDEFEDLKYIGTCQLDGGALIFHLFELVPYPF